MSFEPIFLFCLREGGLCSREATGFVDIRQGLWSRRCLDVAIPGPVRVHMTPPRYEPVRSPEFGAEARKSPKGKCGKLLLFMAELAMMRKED